MADHVAVARLDELRLLPVARRQLGHAQRDIEVLRALGHLLRHLELRGVDDLGAAVGVEHHVLLDQHLVEAGLVLLLERAGDVQAAGVGVGLEHVPKVAPVLLRSEEHTSELQSLMRISYAVFCLKKKNTKIIYESHSYT